MTDFPFEITYARQISFCIIHTEMDVKSVVLGRRTKSDSSTTGEIDDIGHHQLGDN